ncbi:NADP-dependent oxidoreductase domain-containing protein 1-like [Corticium candelabrum]|uniref:NADP-dependent oxidoreductase domain-containing protein 1-like n=1 Tax=Corticium candelabrum TaxID=121492 RepID=UPI002E276B5D|nr:NADP-dependent oxidoreductase domain-containing protein 1-like [Corticium candelabrum]
MDDIANNLSSLQFESALGEEETRLLPLRYRAHAVNVSTCAQATYLVHILNEVRQSVLESRQSKQEKLLQETVTRDPTLVGIIGCGRLGKQLVNSFLVFGRCQPQDIFVSTRRPESVQTLADQGVNIIFDNAKVAKSVHVLFIACLPSQLPVVCKDIRGSINYSTLVYSLVAVTPVSKLCQLLSFKNVFRPEIELLSLDDSCYYPGDMTKDVIESCRDTRVCAMTCPLERPAKGSLVKTHDNWVMGVTLSFLNTCALLHLNMLESFQLVNTIILQTPDQQIVSTSDLTVGRHECDELKPLALCSLTSTAAEQPNLKAKLMDSSVRQLFINKYISIFRIPRLLQK